MAESSSIQCKIGKSRAYRSLRLEAEIAAHVQQCAWNVRHSPYYTDPKTGKSREIDLTGSAYWQKTLKSGDLTVRVNLFVEVKSNSDFHILCAGEAENQTHFAANEYWIGYSVESLARIERLLEKFNLNFEESRRILHRIESLAFPRNTMRTSSLRIEPPSARDCFTAFRETNGEAEKDLDNSVLWRAVLALRSAVQAAQADIIDGIADDLETDLEVARRKKKPLDVSLFSIEHRACRLDLYVPIVVAESRIWSAQLDEPRELEWARLVQYNTFGSPDGWVDVVNFRYFESYLEALTSHFNSAFKKCRAKRWL